MATPAVLQISSGCVQCGDRAHERERLLGHRSEHVVARGVEPDGVRADQGAAAGQPEPQQAIEQQRGREHQQRGRQPKFRQRNSESHERRKQSGKAWPVP